MTINIRRLKASDRSAWEPLWQAYLAFYGVDLAPEVCDVTWRRLVLEKGAMFALGAYDADRLVGFAHCLFHPATWAIADRLYLEDLFVASDARGLGAGRALMDAVFAEAEAQNADKVYWQTEASNRRARALYDQVGTLTAYVRYER
ncbi:GNAT family N-acetyltransferase [Afifella sp. H1R]|uniref:GNAT family N-acetyltransferase n=1 Tax=Afifella sp. H1R TaxID=2908841 RepID=UPI001F38AD3A|nr:GNAT family N-acetyltransferase [Afifella sp. H1R]MCF1502847.1 GNAT family N-acetyltransferase [Afifella sp. H1R]